MELIAISCAAMIFFGLLAVNAMIAEAKGRSQGLVALFSFIVSPLVVYLYLVGMPPKR